MHRRKRKIKHSRHMSRLEKENLIEIQAEAYYRALKQIDKENHSLEKFVAINQEEQRTKKQNLLLFLKLIFIPRKLSAELKSSSFADNFLSFLVSIIIGTIGAGLRLCALLLPFVGILKLYIDCVATSADISMWIAALDYFAFSILLALFGSLFTITGEELSKMKDTEKLYAYTSGIMGALALIVAVISMLIRANC